MLEAIGQDGRSLADAASQAIAQQFGAAIDEVRRRTPKHQLANVLAMLFRARAAAIAAARQRIQQDTKSRRAAARQAIRRPRSTFPGG